MEEPLSQARIEADVFELSGIYYRYLTNLRRFGNNDIVGVSKEIKRFEYLFSEETYEFLSNQPRMNALSSEYLFRNQILKKFVLDNRPLFHNFEVFFSVNVRLQTKKVKVGTQKKYIGEIYAQILNAPSREDRIELSNIYMDNVKKIYRKFAKIYLDAIGFAREFGFSSTLSFLASNNLTDFDLLYSRAKKYMNQTREGFIARTNNFAQIRFDCSLEEINITDFWYFFYGKGNRNNFFNQKTSLKAIFEISKKMGLNIMNSPRAEFDLDHSPIKSPRAMCGLDPLSQDKKIIVVCNPISSKSPINYHILYHEIGHMIHYLNMDEYLDLFSHYVGEIDISEIVAKLFENLIYEPAYISQFWDIPQSKLADFTNNMKFWNEFHQRYIIFLYMMNYELLSLTIDDMNEEIVNLNDIQSNYSGKFLRNFGFRRPGFDFFQPKDKLFESSGYIKALL